MLGEPIFVEDFDIPNTVFYFFDNGTQGELGIGTVADFTGIHSGPFEVLVDKQGILARVEFSNSDFNATRQAERLRRVIYWFWHDLSHFITAMARGQLWWAQGQLETLRRSCLNLARLSNDFADPEVGDEPHFKIDGAIPPERLSALTETYCRLDEGELLSSIIHIVRFFQELAIPLARAHNIPYSEVLERIMIQRLEDLRNAAL